MVIDDQGMVDGGAGGARRFRHVREATKHESSEPGCASTGEGVTMPNEAKDLMIFPFTF